LGVAGYRLYSTKGDLMLGGENFVIELPMEVDAMDGAVLA